MKEKANRTYGAAARSTAPGAAARGTAARSTAPGAAARGAAAHEECAALESRVTACIHEHKLAHAGTPVLLMVSGGSDSTALAHIARHLCNDQVVGTVSVLHVNHRLRGADADADEAFVRALCVQLGFDLTVVDIDVRAIAEAENGNIEAVARRERYASAEEELADLCRRAGCPVSDGRIFVAHTVDDRIENFFMRSIVGTGPGGFRSMRYLNGRVARPLLDCTRDELRDYIRACVSGGTAVQAASASDAQAASASDAQAAAAANAQAAAASDVQAPELWREDATNGHTDRFRAYVRHEIVPLAKAKNPLLAQTLARTMNLIADEDDMLDDMTDDLVIQHVTWLEPAEEGCVLSPWLAAERVPLQRRVAFKVLGRMLGPDARVETASIDAVLSAFADGKPLGGYVANIQGNLAVSANRNGVRIEPMAAFRTRRKRQ